MSDQEYRDAVKDILSPINIGKLFDGMNKEFEPFVFYNSPGDECEVFITSDDYYGKWINPYLTIYYKEGDEKRIVGLCVHIRNKYTVSLSPASSAYSLTGTYPAR